MAVSSSLLVRAVSDEFINDPLVGARAGQCADKGMTKDVPPSYDGPIRSFDRTLEDLMSCIGGERFLPIPEQKNSIFFHRNLEGGG